VHSYLQAPVKWASLWVGLRCLFAAVPAQGRAAGVMCGIAFLKGTDDMRPRTCVNVALRADGQRFVMATQRGLPAGFPSPRGLQ